MAVEKKSGQAAGFAGLQQNFKKQFTDVFPDRLAEKTVVIIPSLTLDQEMLAAIKGHVYYEERMLCMLMLLRMPNTNVVYVSSMPVDPVIVDYYLHLLPGITGYHAKSRLTMLSCYDISAKSLIEKILERPRIIQRIKQHIKSPGAAHLACFNVSQLEKKLALQLGIPIYGCDPDLLHLGSKSGSRKIFRQCKIPVPHGYEFLKDTNDIVHSLIKLKKEKPSLKKAVIKFNEGFSGDGNAVFSYGNLNPGHSPESIIRSSLQHNLKPVAANLTAVTFLEKFSLCGGIVEEFLEGDIKTSPSVQYRVNPLGETEIISTHDQVLGGEGGQVFIGAYFPANNDYQKEIVMLGKKVAAKLAVKGVLGRFAIDFISVKEKNKWKNYAIEINLRKGGTTHPYLMMQFLTDGHYDADKGLYITACGNTRFYFASDNVYNEKYKGLTPYDLIDIAMQHSLMYDGATQKGVMFHLMGALSEHGKLGLVCIGSSHEDAFAYYKKVIEVLDAECT